MSERAPFIAGSRTSEAAAKDPELDLGALRAKVYDHIKGCGGNGSTDDETQVALAMNPSTQRPRRIELWRAGLVFDSGITRPTRSGRQAVVWSTVKRPKRLVWRDNRWQWTP